MWEGGRDVGKKGRGEKMGEKRGKKKGTKGGVGRGAAGEDGRESREQEAQKKEEGGRGKKSNKERLRCCFAVCWVSCHALCSCVVCLQQAARGR